MSYPGSTAVQAEYPAIHDNPINLTMDPEFQALNPGIKKRADNFPSASTILSLSSDSDVIRSLTTYLNSAPEARSWLDGAPDPWGMKVNPNYAKIALTVQTWPQLDSFQPKLFYASGSNPCLQETPVPFLPLIASPTIRMSSISFAMQFAISTSQVVCQRGGSDGNTNIGQKLVGNGRQAPGFRFVLGLTSLGDAARFQLDTAALETTVAPGTAAKFTSDTGRTFVAPTEAGLRAAGALLTPNAKSGAWDLPMARILKDSKAGSAYPGAMVVYAAVSTLGLPAADAQAYAALLRWAATTGQIPGTTSGTLPAGFLPLTAANGLQPLASFTTRAASAVAAQKGDVPSIVQSPTVLKPKATKPSATPGAGGPIASGGGSPSPAPAVSAAEPDATLQPGSAVPTPAGKAAPRLVASNSILPKRMVTVGLDVGLAATLARILLLVALVLGGIAPLAFGVRRLRSRVE
jgi:hypothetical protein